MVSLSGGGLIIVLLTFFPTAVLGPFLVLRVFPSHAESALERSMLLGVSVACGFGQGLFLFIMGFALSKDYGFGGLLGASIQSFVFMIVAVPCIGLPGWIIATAMWKTIDRIYRRGDINKVFLLADVLGASLGIVAGILGLRLPTI